MLDDRRYQIQQILLEQCSSKATLYHQKWIKKRNAVLVLLISKINIEFENIEQ